MLQRCDVYGAVSLLIPGCKTRVICFFFRFDEKWPSDHCKSCVFNAFCVPQLLWTSRDKILNLCVFNSFPVHTLTGQDGTRRDKSFGRRPATFVIIEVIALTKFFDNLTNGAKWLSIDRRTLHNFGFWPIAQKKAADFSTALDLANLPVLLLCKNKCWGGGSTWACRLAINGQGFAVARKLPRFLGGRRDLAIRTVKGAWRRKL